MLRGAPDRHAALVGGRGERVRLDGEVRHHRKSIFAFDHQVRPIGRRSPPERPLAKDVGAGERIAGAALGTLHERRRRVERLLDGDDRRQFLDLNLLADQRGRPPGRIERFGRDRRHGLTKEARLAIGEQWTIGNRRSEARHRFRQVLGA